jgi:F-type H+-transporting ATPase subunit delta
MKAIRLYAQVLVDVLSAPQAEIGMKAAMEELSTFANLFQESALVLKIFDNPTLGDEDKQKALKELSAKTQQSALSARFLSILVKRNRLGLLADILKEVEVIQLEKTGGLMGVITSAVPLDSGVAGSVAQALSKKLNKPVQLKEEVDPGIIAGMRVTIGGITYDGSVKSKLDKLSASFR